MSNTIGRGIGNIGVFLEIQSTLDFATMDIAANLDLTTTKALTDLHQYINSDLVLSDLNIQDFK